jgi:hypothetical protein
MKRKSSQQQEEEQSSSNKKVKYEQLVINNVSIPQEIVNEILLFFTYDELINDVSFVNHYFYDCILGENTNLWERISLHQSIIVQWKHYKQYKQAYTKFLTKYKPPTITIDSSRWNFRSQAVEVNFVNEVATLVEPFVTKFILEIHSSVFIDLARQWRESNNLQFSKLHSIAPVLNIHNVCDLFGSNLEGYKELNIKVKHISDQYSLKFRSLETLKLITEDNILLEDILTQSRHTLKYVNLRLTKHVSSEIFELLSNVTILIIKCEMTEPLKSIVFPNLKQVSFKTTSISMLSFFSVSHPALTAITIKLHNKEEFQASDLYLLPQKSLKKFIFDGPQLIFNKLITSLVSNSNLEHLSIHLDNDLTFNIDWSNITKLESLEFSIDEDLPNFAQGIEHILKQNQISTLNVKYHHNMNFLFPYFNYVSNLTLMEMDIEIFSKVLLLPNLKYLFVEIWKNSYASFTKLLYQTQPINIKGITIDTIWKLRKKNEHIYVIPSSLDYLFFDLTGMDRTEALYPLVFLISTINVKRVKWIAERDMNTLFEHLQINIEYNSNMFAVGYNLFQRIRIELNKILDRNDFFNLIDSEKTIVKNRIEQILDLECLGLVRLRHGIIHALISTAEKQLRKQIKEYYRQDLDDYFRERYTSTFE